LDHDTGEPDPGRGQQAARRDHDMEQIMATLKSASPVLASLNIERTIAFYCGQLGFSKVYAEPGVWGIVSRDSVQLHFWPCDDRHIAENTSCRIYVAGIAELFEACDRQGIVHPNARLESKPWGSREFGVLDPDGNLVTFAGRPDA
jgi:catechol 2,3-dioxygenase-like lactoylglutathione lyase family enzyme